MTRDAWCPDQYERFKEERSQPFHDLLALVRPAPALRVVDLGCGTGELTRHLHRHLGAAHTLGLDTSPAMLEKAAAIAEPGLEFRAGDLGALPPTLGTFDLVFSNAAVQWVDDHPALLARLSAHVAPGGQLAIQVPANHDHPSHVVAAQVATEAPFASLLGGWVRRSPVLPPERYAELLFELGYAEQNVRLAVYAHVLPDEGGVVEWVKGTLLTDYQRRLPPEVWGEFLARYRVRLSTVLPDKRPFFYPFKRTLFWARR